MWSHSIAAVTVLGLSTAGSAFAGDGHKHARGYGHQPRAATHYVYARVVDVDPVVRYVTVDRPSRQCWNEIVHEPVRPYGVAGPTIAGAVVGAAVGRQFGGGSGRDALTLIGAAAGAAVANQRAVRNQGYAVREVAVERCEVVSERHTERRVDGYRVRYVYEGRHYTMLTATPPGDRIRLAVDVRPAAYRH